MIKKFKIATPVSNLFENDEFKKKIIELSDILEIRDNNIDLEKNTTVIYHSDLNILSKWSYNQIKNLENINKKYQVKCVSYHLASRYQKNIIQDNAFVGVGTPLSISEMKMNIRENIKISMEIFGYEIPILVENVNHLLTDAYDIITDTNFIKEIIEENEIFLLLDLAHAKITAFNKNIEFMNYITKLPLNKCKQIHVSRYSINAGRTIDSHDELLEEDWQELNKIMELIDSVDYITLEYYKDGQKLLNQLNILKRIKENLILTNKLQIAEWDTNFFGFKVARLDNSNLDKELLNKCIERAKKEQIACIYCLSDLKNENLLESFGFRRIDERIEYTQEIKSFENSEDVRIENATDDDVPELKRIASKSFRGISRFYKDPHFNQEKIDNLYEKWIEKLIKEKNSKILIIRKNGNIVAFIGISLKDREGIIELIAVDEKFKHNGYGELLIRQAYNFFDKLNRRKKAIKIDGESVYLRTLKEEDVSERYCSWINDPEVNKYLVSKNTTLEELKNYVKIRLNNPNCLFFGIFLKKNNLHIGNVKLEPIDFKKRTAKLGLLLGDKVYWHQGYESETYTLLENYAFKKLKLIEIETGLYKESTEELLNLKKSGFNIYDEEENIYKMKISVATQNRNVAAKKLYTKMGFINQEINYWYHWWNEEILNEKTSN